MKQWKKLSTSFLVSLAIIWLVGCQSDDTNTKLSLSTTETSAQEATNELTNDKDVSKKVVVNPCAECDQTREFRGEFVYFADSAVLRECDSSVPLVVVVNPKMQLAYELHRKAPEAPLYFVAKGQMKLMPSMEEGLSQKQLVVDGDNWYFDAYASCK